MFNDKANKMFRNMVIEYISDRTTTPLKFVDYVYQYQSPQLSYKDDNVLIPNEEKLSLDELVLKVLFFTHFYGSFGDNFETTRDRYRSVLDIWRHVIYYRSDVSIFDVMHSLFNNRTLLIGQYCGNVERRVFKLKEHVENGSLLGVHAHDEFGLQFRDWENI